MPSASILQYLVAFFAAMLAGAVNALAGGGTVISYPGFLFAGLTDKIANATNSFALVPASLGSTVAYRTHLKSQLKLLSILLIPTFLGSLSGALLLVSSSDESFRRVVPFLVLFATLLFAFRDKVTKFSQRFVPAQADDSEVIRPVMIAAAAVFQFAIAFYGGYFGAGIGILMLSSFSVMGMRDIHKMNTLKTALAAAINGTAVVFFIFRGTINWPLGLFAAIGALIGGYGLARVAKRIPPPVIRGFVIVFGLVAASWLFLRGYGLLTL